MDKSRDVGHQVKAYDRLKRHLLAYRGFDILDFDEQAAEVFREIGRGKPRIGSADLKIAAITRACGGVLLSRNLKDFRKVPSLRVEDWTRE